VNLSPIAARLKQEEGFSATPYKDSVGIWTIGYGTNISTISADEAEWLLQNRLSLAAEALVTALPWVESLDDVRLGVLVDLVYNLWIVQFLQFHNTIEAVRTGQWAAAKAGLLNSLWAKQVGPRAINLAEMMLTGVET
jgi:lysozyme